MSVALGLKVRKVTKNQRNFRKPLLCPILRKSLEDLFEKYANEASDLCALGDLLSWMKCVAKWGPVKHQFETDCKYDQCHGLLNCTCVNLYYSIYQSLWKKCSTYMYDDGIAKLIQVLWRLWKPAFPYVGNCLPKEWWSWQCIRGRNMYIGFFCFLFFWVTLRIYVAIFFTN